MTISKTDLCIIGAGSGGLSIAAAAVQMGAKVILIEKHRMGGDCLNYGCVPSKALLSIAKKIHAAKQLTPYGIQTQGELNFEEVKGYVQRVIQKIEPNDSVERFTKLGVNVYLGSAKFIDQKTVEVNSEKIQAKRFIIATGSSAMIPPINGLPETDYLTNESIFEVDELPEHLLIIGGGPIGCEMAQAFAMLGSKVSVFDVQAILPKDDPDLVRLARKSLQDLGVKFYENISIEKISGPDEKHIVILRDNKRQTISGSHILVAAGRQANVENLGLDVARVEYDKKGIKVSNRLRTSNKKMYALGDVIGQYQFTHAASYHAGIIIKNILFKLPSKVSYKAMPWVTYISPELAHVGKSYAELKAIKHQLVTFPMKDNDRAQADGSTMGEIRIAVDSKGKILSATICSEQAGELIGPWVMAMQQNLSIKAMAEVIYPYPTKAEVNKRVAGLYYLPLMTSKKTQAIVKFVLKYLTL